MKFGAMGWVAGAAIVAVVAAGGTYWSQQKAGGGVDFATLATPVGIELQPLGAGQGWGIETHAQFGAIPPFNVAFANTKGMTLYTYDKDVTPGKSSCTGDCATAWPPAIADKDAKPFGDWSVIARDDGARQWAYQGKPLYAFAKDVDPGSIGGNSPRPVGSGVLGGQPKKGKPLPAGWHPALFQPAAEIALPHGIAVHDLAEADGQALVDTRGNTLYAYDGDVNRDSPPCAAGAVCDNPWQPLAAPQLANAAGDFSFVMRNDGIKQWAYKSKPLYTFAGDLAPGYANGADVDKHWQVALVRRYFMPAGASIHRTPGRGKVLATADGRTLYRRDAVGYQSGGGHSLRHGTLIRPEVGREINTKGCDNECAKAWHPFLAPADAQPSGYWDVVTRADGAKQWAYWGFALYTYDGDKKPGDMTGNDIYDIALSNDPNVAVDLGTPEVGALALYWRIAEP